MFQGTAVVVLIILLQRIEVVDKDIIVGQFWWNIYNHIQKHMMKCTDADGSKCVYEYIWEESSQALKIR